MPCDSSSMLVKSTSMSGSAYAHWDGSMAADEPCYKRRRLCNDDASCDAPFMSTSAYTSNSPLRRQRRLLNDKCSGKQQHQLRACAGAPDFSEAFSAWEAAMQLGGAEHKLVGPAGAAASTQGSGDYSTATARTAGTDSPTLNNNAAQHDYDPAAIEAAAAQCVGLYEELLCLWQAGLKCELLGDASSNDAMSVDNSIISIAGSTCWTQQTPSTPLPASTVQCDDELHYLWQAGLEPEQPARSTDVTSTVQNSTQGCSNVSSGSMAAASRRSRKQRRQQQYGNSHEDESMCYATTGEIATAKALAKAALTATARRCAHSKGVAAAGEELCAARKFVSFKDEPHVGGVLEHRRLYLKDDPPCHASQDPIDAQPLPPKRSTKRPKRQL